jgi:hypothetical protein
MPRYEIENEGKRYEVEAANEAEALSVFQPKPASTGVVDQAADFAQGLGAGAKRGIFNAAGLPAQLGQAAQYGVDWAKSAAQGRPFEDVRAESRANAVISPEALDRVSPEGLTKGYLANEGELYQPKGFAGRAGQSIGEFAPIAAMPLGPAGALTRLGMGAVVPGVAAAGATELTGDPLYGAAAAIASPLALSRLITPIASIPGRAQSAAVPFLEEQGVRLTAGQRTGNRRLQWGESVAGDSLGAGGAATNALERGGQTFTRAASREMGAEADRLTPEVFTTNRARLGGEFRDLSNRYNLDANAGGLQNRLLDIMNEHLPDMTTANQNRFMNIITDRLAPNMHNGQMPGPRYQGLRSSLTNIARGATNGQDRSFELAVRGLRNALDDTMEATIAASGNAADVGRWGAARGQWGAMRTLEDALASNSALAAQGVVTPAALGTATRARIGATGNAQSATHLNELARAGNEVMSPLPQSGTAPREAIRALTMAIGAGLGHSAAGVEGALPGAMAAAAAPAVAGRAIMSAPMQAWLGNMIFAHNPDTRVQSLLRAIGRGRATAAHESVEDRR